MKKCKHCGATHPDDAVFCEICGKRMTSKPIILRGVIGVIALIAIVGTVYILLNKKPSPPPQPVDVCAQFTAPALNENICEAIAVFDGNDKDGKNGKAMTFVIARDLQNNWELRSSNTFEYSGADYIMDVGGFLRTNMHDLNPKKEMYVFKPEKSGDCREYLAKKLLSGIMNELQPWDAGKSDMYLQFALIPPSLKDKSCMMKVDINQIVFFWTNSDGTRGQRVIPETGYQLSDKPDEDKISNIINNEIPERNRAFIFTSGYNIEKMENEISVHFPAKDFITAREFLPSPLLDKTEDINLKRTLEIYRAVHAATRSSCLIYRKNVHPEIGFLLNNKQ
jgi:hypothetical protein